MNVELSREFDSLLYKSGNTRVNPAHPLVESSLRLGKQSCSRCLWPPGRLGHAYGFSPCDLANAWDGRAEQVCLWASQSVLDTTPKLSNALDPCFQVSLHVDGCSRDRLVPQHRLDQGQVAVGLLEQLVREGVAQPVG